MPRVEFAFHDPQSTRYIVAVGTSPGRTSDRVGFSLVELLVVVGIIAILLSILIPTLSRIRAQANQVKCASNLRQMMHASMIYSKENSGGWYITNFDKNNDSLECLIPAYIKDPNVAVCPATKNVVSLQVVSTESYNVGGNPAIREFYPHLRTPAGYAEHERGGHSYEVFAWGGKATYPDGSIVSKDYIMTYKNVRRPSETFILLDYDQGAFGTMNNWPEKIDNHGARGINLGFVDGHVEFVDRGGMVRAFIKSRHPWPCNDNAQDIQRALDAVPGLRNQGGWAGRWWYQ